jgi:hypothetical protein
VLVPLAPADILHVLQMEFGNAGRHQAW